jgi:Ca2+-binding EF-hand superfamily protein
MYDSDGSGTIELDELKESLLKHFPQEELESLIKQLNFNTSTDITLYEFQKFYR